MNNALDSRTIRTIILSLIMYVMAKYAVPKHFSNAVVQGAVADVIVFVGFSVAAWYRKEARGTIKSWWGHRDD